mmetsp:Transcript_3561/g.8502  ORF Transcript_3561/g.8502 Transcript_3561/m.8502 type:complete len:241 (-) Transcript_3561:1026-1748(-)
MYACTTSILCSSSEVTSWGKVPPLPIHLSRPRNTQDSFGSACASCSWISWGSVSMSMFLSLAIRRKNACAHAREHPLEQQKWRRGGQPHPPQQYLPGGRVSAGILGEGRGCSRSEWDGGPLSAQRRGEGRMSQRTRMMPRQWILPLEQSTSSSLRWRIILTRVISSPERPSGGGTLAMSRPRSSTGMLPRPPGSHSLQALLSCFRSDSLSSSRLLFLLLLKFWRTIAMMRLSRTNAPTMK